MDRLDFFKQFYDLDINAYTLILNKLKNKNCRKGEILVAPGQIQRELYFVNKGVQMSFFDAENKDYVVAFTYPPFLCAIPDSFSLQIPSKYYLICVTDSEFQYLTYDDLEELFNQSQSIERLFRKMTESILSGVINHQIDLKRLTMEERYLIFCRRSPHLLQLIPHKYIASYLGIDPTNFSKLFNNVKI